MKLGRYKRIVVLMIGVLLLVPCAAAEEAPPEKGGKSETILVRNVILLNQEGEGEDVMVNILIRDKKLDVVTRDDIPPEDMSLALDAERGVLLGKLIPGQPPSFIIVDGDPREDIQVLLNTSVHVRFAMEDGVVERNRLQRIYVTGESPERSGWLAYTPPPLSLPGSYQDKSKWNRWDTRYISGIFTGAVLLDRQNWLWQDSSSENQVGDLDAYSGGEIRGLRFGVVGTLNFPQPWVYTMFGATHGFDKGFDAQLDDDFGLYDLRVDIPTLAGTTLSIGKQKEPITMARTMGMIYLPMQERGAVSDAFFPARNIGVVISGGGLGRRLTWAGGVFNNWLESDQSFDESASQAVGRITWLPFLSEDESNLLHVGFGARYSNAKEGTQYLSEPEFNQSPVFVDTSFLETDSATTYNAELSWRKGPFWLLGEYAFSDVEASTISNPDFSGYFVTASWALTGEMRPYNHKSGSFRPLPVSKSVYHGGAGAWEAAVRWSDIDLADGAVDGGEMQILSLGLNWWLTPLFCFNANYRHIVLDRFDEKGQSDGIMTRLVLILE